MIMILIVTMTVLTTLVDPPLRWKCLRIDSYRCIIVFRKSYFFHAHRLHELFFDAITNIFLKSASRKSSKLSMVFFGSIMISDDRFFCWTRRFFFLFPHHYTPPRCCAQSLGPQYPPQEPFDKFETRK